MFIHLHTNVEHHSDRCVSAQICQMTRGRDLEESITVCYKRSRDKVYARDNERKGHKERRRRREGVNEAVGKQKREKERAMEGWC